MSAVTEAAPCGPDGPPACATTPGSGVETAAPPLPAAEGGASQLKVAETRVAELERELAACKRAAEVTNPAPNSAAAHFSHFFH